MVLMGLRKAMMRLHTFYVQLLDMAEELQGAAGEILVKEEENCLVRVFKQSVPSS